MQLRIGSLYTMSCARVIYNFLTPSVHPWLRLIPDIMAKHTWKSITLFALCLKTVFMLFWVKYAFPMTELTQASPKMVMEGNSFSNAVFMAFRKFSSQYL